MLTKVQAFIQSQQLLQTRNKVIVGLSGGADSVALLLVLHKLGFACIAAHCNFSLRDQESDADETFVVKLCADFKIRLHKVRFNTAEIAKERKISIEMAARDLRYAWFEELRLTENAQAIAVAHHADDNVETVLMNLVRGTGIRGLCGIPAKNDQVVRPLLNSTRNEIIHFLESHSQAYVIDSSNASDEYRRNRFRNQIIPLLEEINPAFKSGINNTVSYLNAANHFFAERIGQIKTEICRFEGSHLQIDVQALQQVAFAETVLFEILSPYQFNADVVSSIFESLDRESGLIFYSKTHKLLIDRHVIVVNELVQYAPASYLVENVSRSYTEPFSYNTYIRPYKGEYKKETTCATLDIAKLQFPLEWRNWRAGDVFYPLGMQGKKKLSDYFIDLKISRFEKEKIWLLTSGNEIVWIAGYRLDRRFTVSEFTETSFEIQMSS